MLTQPTTTFKSIPMLLDFTNSIQCGRGDIAKSRGGKAGARSGGGGSASTDEEMLRDAGVDGSRLRSELSTLQKLDDRNPGDRAFRQALLSPRDRMPDEGSSLDRIVDLRRLANRERLKSQNDIRDAANSFRQGLRGGNGSASNLATLEYSAQIYNRLTPAGRNAFAREVSTGLPRDSRMESNPRFRSLIQDIQRRQERIGDARFLAPRISRGRSRRLAQDGGNGNDDPFF